MENWVDKLLHWYEKEKRDLPWRNTGDPYKIWVSEIILQQTRVNQGIDYYLRFVSKYPTVSSLAAASEDDVLKMWQGLGYYSRARNMLHTARYIEESLGGKFPRTYQQIRGLKGIGDYTAAAIVSFAFNQPYAVLDGNVMRVYSRLLGIDEPVDSSSGRKKLQLIANDYLPEKNSASYNQAVMELGALICLPKKPFCTQCPIQDQCYAYSHTLTAKLPVKQVKKKIVKRFLNYLVIQSGDSIIMRKRPRGDIWQGLYDFPCIETAAAGTPLALASSKEWRRIFRNRKVIVLSVSSEYRHVLTHRLLLAKFISLKAGRKEIELPEGCEWIKLRNISDYPVPRLIDIYLSENFLNLNN